MNRGLLLTLTEPPAGMEEEFNAWYDDVPAGAGKYLATYEFDSVAVLSSAAYLQRFENPTPWSRRCLGSAIVFKRWACEQVDPGTADPHPQAKTVRLNSEVAGALQRRTFVALTGEHIVLSEFSDPATRSSDGIAYRLYRP